MVEYQLFGPQNFVARHENPSTGEGFNGFRSVFKPCSMVFAVVDGLVLVTAEWKHGNNRITIVPVAGVPGKAEADLPLREKMRRTALREWEEETGTKLVSVEALGPEEGIWSVVRQTESHCFPYLGTVATPIQKGPTKLDQNETLIMVAFPLSEWVKLIESPELWDENPEFGLEVCSRDITYAALRKLGKLKLTV
jgi:8-oxo-dGTP pyrophosphatase MutT (NUDIX family)